MKWSSSIQMFLSVHFNQSIGEKIYKGVEPKKCIHVDTLVSVAQT